MTATLAPTSEARSPTRDDVLAALHTCYDPCCADKQISIVDMGLIEHVEVRERTVKIVMILTSGWCPFVGRLFGMVQESVEALPGVENAEVEVVWNPVWTAERMSGEAKRKLRLPMEQLLPLREARAKGCAL